MKIYLVRHGESLATGADNQRPLSDQGKIQIQGLAHFILPLNLRVLRILHSEKHRAQQTAEILASSIHAKEPMEARLELDPLAPVTSIIEEILLENHDIMLVGHMPFMGRLVAKLVAGNENKNIVTFKTGTMLCLEQIEAKEWAIRWMLGPELFIS